MLAAKGAEARVLAGAVESRIQSQVHHCRVATVWGELYLS